MNRLLSPLLAHGALAFILASTLAACGNLTAGGIGEATVIISGDAPDVVAPQMVVASPSPSSTPSSSQPGPSATERPSPSDDDDNDPEGQFEADLSVFLIAADGTLVPVSDGEVEIRLDLEGMEEPEAGTRRVSAALYQAIRVVFTKIEVEVDAGLIINGQPLVGPIDIDFGDISLTVEKPLDLDIGDGERAEVVVDLNADLWLQAVDPVTRSVDAQTFVDLVAVSVR